MKHNVWNHRSVHVAVRISDVRIIGVIKSGGRHIKPRRWIPVSLQNGQPVPFFIICDQSPPVSPMSCVDQRIESELIVWVVGTEGSVCIYRKARFIEDGMART